MVINLLPAFSIRIKHSLVAAVTMTQGGSSTIRAPSLLYQYPNKYLLLLKVIVNFQLITELKEHLKSMAEINYLNFTIKKEIINLLGT